MNFSKTTIAMSALAASLISAQASALMVEDPDAPKIVYKTKISCLVGYGSDGGTTIYGSNFCDQSANNKKNKRPIKANGCAEDQVAVSETVSVTAGEKLKIKIKACAVEDDSEVQPMQL